MVDLLILNYNDAKTTLMLVDKVKEYNSINRILIVDNMSTDNSLSLLREKTREKVIIVSTGKNGGYGAGNNYGINYLYEHYGSEYILLANPDISVLDKTILKMEQFLKIHTDYVMVAPFMCNSYGVKMGNSGWKIPSSTQYIFAMGLLYSKFMQPGIIPNLIKKNDDVLDVDAISGSLFLMNTKHMIDYGMYDEKIFLYCEETVLGIKFKKHKLKSALLMKENYIHNHSVSISKTYNSEIQRRRIMLKSKLYVLKKYYSISIIKYLLAVTI